MHLLSKTFSSPVVLMKQHSKGLMRANPQVQG